MRYLTIFFSMILMSAASPVTESGRIFLSTDGGHSWLPYDDGFPPTGIINAWTYSAGSLLAATEGHGIYVHDTVLKRWVAWNSGLPPGVRVRAVTTFQDLWVAGTSGNGIYVSQGYGRNWRPASKGLINFRVRAFFADDEMMLAGTDDGIYQYVNDERSWKLVQRGFQVNAFASIGDTFFAATNQGTFRSIDRIHWSPCGPGRAVADLAISGADLFATGFDQRLFKSPDLGLTWLPVTNGLPEYYKFQRKAVDWLSGKKGLQDKRPETWWDPEMGSEDQIFTKTLSTPWGILIGVGNGGC